MPETVQGEQGLVIANILPSLTTMTKVLADSKLRIGKAEAGAGALIERCKDGPMTAEKDADCMNMIIKLKKTQEDMAGQRKPYTQLMDEIKSTFTGLENRFQPLLDNLQKFRDQRAREVAAENKRREQEAAKAAAKKKEAADIIASMTASISRCLNNKLYTRKNELHNLFNGLTLADIDERGENLKKLKNAFPTAKLAEILVFTPVAANHHSDIEVEALRKEVERGFDWTGFYTTYEQELDEVKNDLVIRLGSKRSELQEAERLRLEQERIKKEQQEARERQAKLDRDAAQAKSDADKKRLEEEQEKEKFRQAALKLQEEEAENQRKKLQKEEDDRKEQQRLKDEADKARKDQEGDNKAEAVRIAAHGQTLFDQTNQAQMKEAEGEVRKGWEIIIKEPAGWVEIFQFWFLNAMAAAWQKDPEKVGDIDLNAMKRYAEKQADKQRIESPLLEYKETVKAVNRDTKKKNK